MPPPLYKFIVIQVVVISFALGWFANDTYDQTVAGSTDAVASSASSASSASTSDEELVSEVLSASPACVRDGAADAAKAASRQVSVDDLYAAEAKCLAESEPPAAQASSPSTPGDK